MVVHSSWTFQAGLKWRLINTRQATILYFPSSNAPSHCNRKTRSRDKLRISQDSIQNGQSPLKDGASELESCFLGIRNLQEMMVLHRGSEDSSGARDSTVAEEEEKEEEEEDEKRRKKRKQCARESPYDILMDFE